MSFKEKVEGSWLADFLCPDGRCTKEVNSKSGIRTKCNGKLCKVFNCYGPLYGKNEFETYEEIKCLKCRFHRKIKLISSHIPRKKSNKVYKQFNRNEQYRLDDKIELSNQKGE